MFLHETKNKLGKNWKRDATNTIVLLSMIVLFRETGFFELISIGL
jgi:hypothetical protein